MSWTARLEEAGLRTDVIEFLHLRSVMRFLSTLLSVRSARFRKQKSTTSVIIFKHSSIDNNWKNKTTHPLVVKIKKKYKSVLWEKFSKINSTTHLYMYIYLNLTVCRNKRLCASTCQSVDYFASVCHQQLRKKYATTIFHPTQSFVMDFFLLWQHCRVK